MTSATATRTDDEIQRDVLAELKWDSRLHPNEIGVIVKDGVVTLTGWVDSYIKKWAAERAAERVRGVVAIANDIEVRLPDSEKRTDADIAAAAARALDANALVPNDRIKVAVSNGWVTLRGDVDWEYQRRDAEWVVHRLPGVVGVTNVIAVRPRAAVEPEELKRRIQHALVRSAETDAEHITVTVVGDKVILDGVVGSWVERGKAARVAWHAPGVTQVENRITVRP